MWPFGFLARTRPKKASPFSGPARGFRLDRTKWQIDMTYARNPLRARFQGVTVRKLTIVVVLALAGCASTPGPQPGKVGTSEVIDGIEVWKGGPPSRPYRVIANVNREAADSSTTFGEQEESIASEARQRGADAVIVLNAVMAVGRVDVINGRPIMAPKVAAQLIKYQ